MYCEKQFKILLKISYYNFSKNVKNIMFTVTQVIPSGCKWFYWLKSLKPLKSL